MSRRMLCLGVAVAFAGILVMLVGCDKVERARYEMVKLGMDKYTVKKIMKVEPTTETEDTILYIPDPDKEPLRVEFEFDKDGKLVKKEWLDRKNL